MPHANRTALFSPIRLVHGGIFPLGGLHDGQRDCFGAWQGNIVYVHHDGQRRGEYFCAYDNLYMVPRVVHFP
jgi:hypothetical protein